MTTTPLDLTRPKPPARYHEPFESLIIETGGESIQLALEWERALDPLLDALRQSQEREAMLREALREIEAVRPQVSLRETIGAILTVQNVARTALAATKGGDTPLTEVVD